MKNRLSILALILANVTPIIGVTFFGWNLFNILILFWVENVIIGVFAILKMLRINLLGGAFLSAFFVVHYGAFMYGHLFFLTFFFGNTHETLSAVVRQNLPIVYLSIISIFISHGISFFTNFIGKQEYLQTNVQKEMTAPYGRMVVMHLTLIFGGWLVMLLKSPMWLLVMLVVIKTVVDLSAHRKQHSNYSGHFSTMSKSL